MRAKNRKKHRRYSGKRRSDRNRSKIAVLLIIVFIIAVFICSVYLGNHLKEKAEISEASRQTQAPDTVKIPENDNKNDDSILSDTRPPQKFKGEYLPLDEIEAFLNGGKDGSAVTLIMRDSAGKLNYSSSVAQTLGTQTVDNGLLSAEDIVGKLDAKNCYISAYVAHSNHVGDSSALTNALHAFEGAMFAELSAAGFDEIILCGFQAADEERVDALCEFSRSYREEGNNDVPLGILLPYDFYISDGASELCRKLYEHFEIIAVDYTDVVGTEELSFSEAIKARIDSMQMFFSRYAVRVLLDSDNAEYLDAAAAVADAAIYSVQSVSREDLLGQ